MENFILNESFMNMTIRILSQRAPKLFWLIHFVFSRNLRENKIQKISKETFRRFKNIQEL
jgi:hypothetical protein